VQSVTRRLDTAVDLNRFASSSGFLFARDNSGLAGRGIAARVPAERAREFLASLDVRDEVDRPGSGPVLFGAVPFDGDRPHEFVLPQVMVACDESGDSWVTTIDDASLESFTQEPPASTSNLRPSFRVRPGVAIDHYLAAVSAARDAVARGELEKVVIARDVIVESDEPIDVAALTARLRQSFGSSYRYLIDGLVGASPELLIERRGNLVSSHPLAGTTPRTGDPSTDERLARELLASTKNQVEHRIVIDMVHDTLLPHCSYLDWEEQPSVVPVANVQHLGTLMSGRLSEPLLHVLDAVHLLSPTPALGGSPRAAALDVIARYEGMDRGRYGGAVGWFDRHGNGTFAVTIRCAEVDTQHRVARLYAGGGIVAESEPLAELAETQAKFQAMLAAIIRT
jgi:menaquinone-specific isochorismate synthase